MSLRVLLIDNSDTIKRAIEMSLQDYGVSVKTMSTGADVTNVIESFKPDIVFSDIMLREKSGYEVAEELKNFQSDLPVVLLWSEFMNFNEKKAKDSGAVTHLRKPFDKEQLQKIVKEYVQSSDDSKPAQQPSTTEDSTSTQQDEEMGGEEDSFRDFFELPDDGAPTQVTSLSEVDPNKSEQNEKSSSDSTDVMWSIDKTPETEMNESELPEPEEEKEDFIQADINEIPPLENLSIEESSAPIQSDDEKKEDSTHEEKNFSNLSEIPPLEEVPQPPPVLDDTSQEKKNDFTNLSEIPPLEEVPQPPPISHHASEEKESRDYKVDVPEENVDFDEMTVGFSEPIDSKKTPSLDDTEVLPTRKNKPDTEEQLAPPPDENLKTSSTSKPLSEEELKKIIGEQSREVIEKIVWQLVPDMASNIIREELNRLLNDNNK